jgi:lantibiotic biosynthesis protein
MDWEPVLRGDLAVAARNRILEILNALARLDFSGDSALERADRILLASYLAAAGIELPYGSGVEGLFDTAISSLPPDLPSGIFNGLTSIGWTIQHCTQSSGPPDAADVEIQDPLEDVEQLILARLRVDCWTESYDLVSGLVGIGVYFLERLPAAEASQGLSLVVGHLEKLATTDATGTTWHTPARLLPPKQRDRCPDGHYNLGVAHGVPGIVFILSEAIVAGVETPRAKELLTGAVTWLLGQEQSAEPEQAGYSHWIGGDAPPRFRRPAWCYGDLGIAAVLAHVGDRLAWAQVSDSAEALIERSLNRLAVPTEATLCHGALGVAHICNRLYQATARVTYKAAAHFYYESALSMLTRSEPDVSRGRHEGSLSTRFLQGAIGVALGLLSAIEPIEPQWDRRLLLSGRRF